MKSIRENNSQLLKLFSEQKEDLKRLWNINETTAELLFFLVQLKKPARILEIGSSNGYSTLWLSLATERIHSVIETIEAEKNRLALAKRNLTDREGIIFHFGKAEKVIPALKGKFDFVFIDAGKIGYIDYIKLLKSKLNFDALIIADNVISHEKSVQEYLDFISRSSEFISMTLPIDAGLEISIYNKAEDQ